MNVITLSGYSATADVKRLELGTFDSFGIEQLQVIKGDGWEDLSVIATFNPPNKKPVQVVVDSVTGIFDVPKEATEKLYGVGTIVFVGLADGVQRISADVEYIVKKHSNASGTEPAEPTPSVVQQILTEAQNANKTSADAKKLATDAKDIAQSVRTDADEGKFNCAKGDKGDTGITPQLKIGEDNLWHVSYDNGETWVSLGVKATGDTGAAGEDGVTPHIGENGNWWIGDTDTGVLAKGLKGDTGEKGADGVSPTAAVTQTDDGAEFTVTDASGTTTATIRNGTDGKDGAPGAPGKDAVVDATLTQDGQAADAKVTGEKISQLKEDIGELIDTETVVKIEFEQGSIRSINYSFEFIESTTRVRTLSPVPIKAGQYISIKSPGYKMRLFYEYNQGHVATDWVNEFTISKNKNELWLVVARTNDGEITTSEAKKIEFDTNITGWLVTNREAKVTMDKVFSNIKEYAEPLQNPFSLNKNLYGLNDMIWSWWYYPQVISFNRIRNKVYWGYTTHDGYTGIASYDINTKETAKTHLKKSDVDDHNGLCIYILEKGTIICAYSGGHNTDSKMHIRISKTPESIDEFCDEIVLECSGKTSYGQFINYSGKLFLFYRLDNGKWAYRYSNDKGLSWTSETVLIKASTQYYCLFRETTTSGIVRVLMCSNPGASDNGIRQAFFHLDSLTVYNSDNTEKLGLADISNKSVDVLIPLTDGFSTQRLLDCAKTSIDNPTILYAPFNVDKSDDAVYYLHNNGINQRIVNAGQALWNPKYQGGAAFINEKKIVLSRSELGIEYIEIWENKENQITKTKEIYSEKKGEIPIRNARPIVDIAGKTFLWHRGYYNFVDYTDFNSDARIYLIT
nr:MAG TPA: BNR repeat-containing family member [Bacteriophage sp.]